METIIQVVSRIKSDIGRKVEVKDQSYIIVGSIKLNYCLNQIMILSSIYNIWIVNLLGGLKLMIINLY